MDADSKPLCHVFDIDDTLYLERDYVRSGFEAVGAHLDESLSLKGFGTIAWRLFEQGTRGNTFDLALQRLGHKSTSSEIESLVDIYRRHRPQISLLPDARIALTRAANEGPFAFITDGPLLSQQAKAEALGLTNMGAFIIYTSALGEGCGKPHHISYKMVEDKFGSQYDYVYYADNPKKDFIAPESLGWKYVRVRRREGLYSALPARTDGKRLKESEILLLEEVGGASQRVG